MFAVLFIIILAISVDSFIACWIDIHFLRIIPFFAEAAFSPVGMSASPKCSISGFEDSMIDMILTDYQVGPVFNVGKMMDLSSRRQRFAESPFRYKDMIIYISINFGSWMTPKEGHNISSIINDFSTFPRRITFSYSIMTMNKPKWFSFLPAKSALCSFCRFCYITASALAETFGYRFHKVSLTQEINLCQYL